MRKHILCSFFICLCCLFFSCYVETGCDISNNLNKKITYLDNDYIICDLGFLINGGKPTTDLFQKRGSNEFITFFLYLHKKYKPKEKDINVEINNPIYKLKNNEKCFVFEKSYQYPIDLYYSNEQKNLQKHYVSFEDRKLGFTGGYSIDFDFFEPVKARSLEYIEFDLRITDEEGEIHDYHLHYDVTIKPVFKIGSTLWEYWSSI